MDFTQRTEGNVILFIPNTQAGRDFLAEHLPEDNMTWGQVALVVEHRNLPDVMDAIEGTGLEVEWS